MREVFVAASNFVASYANASALGADPSNTPTSVAEALASHYPLATPFTAFTFGEVTVFPDRQAASQKIAVHLERFMASGLGIDIFMREHRVEVVSADSALCWITWGIKPQDGTDRWTWENVYGYRRVGGQEHWEFVVADQEIGNLMKMKPGIMEN
jgi:hypothetical protein